MSHWIFVLYLLAFLTGIACSVSLLAKRRSYRGLVEALVLNWLVALFTLWGAVILYATVNLDVVFQSARIFCAGAGFILSALVVCIPWQSNAMLGLGNKRLHWFGALAFVSTVSSVSILLLPSERGVFAILTPIVCLIAAVIHTQWASRSHRKEKGVGPVKEGSSAFAHFSDTSLGQTHRTLALFLPLLYMLLGLSEGVLFGDYVLERGVTLTLPLIYLSASVSLWYSVDWAFPKVTQPDVSKDGLLYDGSTNGPPVLNYPEQLTKKEIEVAHAVYQGLSNKQIAHQLSVAPSTVKNHLYSIFKKVGVSNRVALIRTLSSELRAS